MHFYAVSSLLPNLQLPSYNRIRVVFSISDISGPEYETAAEDEANEGESDMPSSNPIHVSISITKVRNALLVDVTAQLTAFHCDS